MTAIRVELRGHRDASYDVIVGTGVLGQLPALLRERCPASRYAIVADHRVAELHGKALMERLEGAGLVPALLTFPSGEWNKTREQWAALTDALLAAGVGRDGAILAFGGGVAGDLGGFVAATYLRGIPVVQLPTTLLAMMDSSVGGKTGVDVPAGKNLVGAFHQPAFVLADIAWLATLPASHIAAGMAEAIKHGVIADAAYFERLGQASGNCFAKDLACLEDVVRRSVAIKAEVVASDEREGGRRQILNFGHTIGHAIETLSGFDLLHGEAVAIGMVVEAAIAESAGVAPRGTRAEIRALLERFRLPVSAADFGVERVMDVMRSDKKVRNGRVRMALPSRIGAMSQSADGAWTVEVPEDAIGNAISLK